MPVTSCVPPFASERVLASLDQVFTQALSERTFSGASLLVAKPDLILFHKTWGRTHDGGGGSTIDGHTFFDLASLTKPLITAPLYMHAVSEGVLDLDERLDRFFSAGLLPEDKRAITIRQLLCHSSGFPAYEPFFRELISIEPSERRDALLAKILATPLLSQPGRVSCYSDLGFILLGIMLEVTHGKPLDSIAGQFLLRRFNDSLGFCRLKVPTNPIVSPERLTTVARAFAATEYCPWRNRLLAGEVHDENAYCMGGVAGHAGLFGTAHGVYQLLMFLWDVYRNRTTHRSWSADVVQEFWMKQCGAPDGTWMLGFDTPSPENSSAGKYFSPRSVGHLGFTGTSFWFDLDREILVILLTNRVHPTRENERMKDFRPLLHNLVMETYCGISRN